MPNIIPTSEWSDVYQIETNDEVLGGPEGVANAQAIALANRTEFLKARAESSKSIETVESTDDLLAVDNPKDGQVVFVKDVGQNHTYQSGAWDVSGKKAHVFNVLDYVRDGDTNHTEAFRRVSLILQEFGGKAVFPYNNGEPYIVGKQVRNLIPNPDVYPYVRAYIGEKIFDIRDATKPIELEFEGCTIKYADGMRFGRWSDTVDEPILGEGVFYGDRNRADIGSIFELRNNNVVKISGSCVLNGNGVNARIGGTYGDHGRQTFHKAFYFNFNKQLVNNANIEIYDFLSDGVYHGAVLSSDETQFENVWREKSNKPLGLTYIHGLTVSGSGRQGMSFAGGSAHIDSCEFLDIGRGIIKSNPQSAFDLEAESGDIRSVLFTHCKFANATGYGLIDTSGSVEDCKAYKCTFSSGIDSVAAIQSCATSLDDCLVVGLAYIGDMDKKPITVEQTTFTNNPDKYIGSVGTEKVLISPLYNNSLFSRDAPTLINNCDFELSSGVFTWIETAGICFEFNNCKFILNENFIGNGVDGIVGNFRKTILSNCKFMDKRVDKSQSLRVIVDASTISNTEIVPTVEKTLTWHIGGQQGYFSPTLPTTNRYIAESYVGLTPLEDYAGTGATRRIVAMRNIPSQPSDTGNPFSRGDIILNSQPNNDWLNLTFTASGYTCANTWSTEQSYVVNSYTSSSGKVYKRVSDGNSTVVPSHTSGIVDGWEYFGQKAVYETVGKKVTGLGATSTAAEIVQALKNAGIAI